MKIFAGEAIGNRPLLLLGILLVFTGVQLVTLGLLAELQARTYHESQDKPTYVIREIRESHAQPVSRRRAPSRLSDGSQRAGHAAARRAPAAGDGLGGADGGGCRRARRRPRRRRCCSSAISPPTRCRPAAASGSRSFRRSALTVASISLRSLRWIFLLRRAETRIPIRDAYIGYFSGLSLLFAPLLAGEIAVRAWVNRKRGQVPVHTTIVVNIWERLLDLSALSLLAGLAGLAHRRGDAVGPRAAGAVPSCRSSRRCGASRWRSSSGRQRRSRARLTTDPPRGSGTWATCEPGTQRLPRASRRGCCRRRGCGCWRGSRCIR